MRPQEDIFVEVVKLTCLPEEALDNSDFLRDQSVLIDDRAVGLHELVVLTMGSLRVCCFRSHMKRGDAGLRDVVSVFVE